MRTALSFITALAGCVVLAAGCSTSYEDREKFLDRMTTAGIAYRADLLKQGTPVSEDACRIGWGLFHVDIPNDGDGSDINETWKAQVQEAYIKGCMTGQPRPKPEPSGVHAVTVVPNGSPGTTSSPAGPPSAS